MIFFLLIKYCWLEDREEKIDCQEVQEYGRLHCHQANSLPQPASSDHCLQWKTAISSDCVAVDSRNYNTILVGPHRHRRTAGHTGATLGKLEYIQTLTLTDTVASR